MLYLKKYCIPIDSVSDIRMHNVSDYMDTSGNLIR